MKRKLYILAATLIAAAALGGVAGADIIGGQTYYSANSWPNIWQNSGGAGFNSWDGGWTASSTSGTSNCLDGAHQYGIGYFNAAGDLIEYSPGNYAWAWSGPGVCQFTTFLSVAYGKPKCMIQGTGGYFKFLRCQAVNN